MSQNGFVIFCCLNMRRPGSRSLSTIWFQFGHPWRAGPRSSREAAERRRIAWDAYRSDFLGKLPDDKNTMFAETFGVRKVFVQPVASYHVAGSSARVEHVTDVGKLIGGLISTRVPGDELIILCGGPGSGKSTLCRIFCKRTGNEPKYSPCVLASSPPEGRSGNKGLY